MDLDPLGLGWGHTYDAKYHLMDPRVRLRIELHDGRILDWHTFHKSYHKLNKFSELSNFIHISAWTLPITMLGCEENQDGDDICQTKIDLKDGGHIIWEFHPTTNKPVVDQTFFGIQIADTHLKEKSRGLVGPALMVVCDLGDRMERVGFGWIQHRNCKMFDASGAPVIERVLNRDMISVPVLMKSWREIRLG
jgi:hypothetical protein